MAALGSAAVVLVVITAVLPNLPCEAPGGDECPPPDDAIELVPSGALAYAHANLDPETEQYQAAVEIAGRTPLLTRQVAGRLLPLLIGAAGQPSDFASEIEPWFGGEVAVAAIGGPGTIARQVQLLEVADDAGAREYAESIAAGVTATEDYHDIEVSEDERGLATAIVNGFLVLGTGSGVREVVDVATGAEGVESLAGDPVAERALGGLPDFRVAEAYVSEDGVERYVGDEAGPLSTLEPLVDAGASRGVAVGLSADEHGLEVATRSILDPERAESSPGFFAAFDAFEPKLPERLSADTFAYLGLGEPRRTFGLLLAQATARAPAIASGLTDVITELRDAAGVDLERDLLSTLQGEAAIAVVGRPSPEEADPDAGLPGLPAPDTLVPGAGEPPYLELLADDVDPERTRDALARLQGPIARALADPSLGAPVFGQQTFGDVEAQLLRISPTTQLAYAVVDSLLVIANDPVGVERVATLEGEALADSERYSDATEGLADDDPSFLVYLDLAGLLSFGESGGVVEFGTYGDDVSRLQTLALTVSSSDDELRGDARLTIDPR